MIAVLTCAHVGLLDVLLNFRHAAFRLAYRDRVLRRRQYMESVQRFLTYRACFDKIYIVECVSRQAPLYLEKGNGVGCAVSRNSLDSTNKGINEFINVANFLKKTNLDGAQMILKMTGRYLLERGSFLEFCGESSADAVVRADSDVWGDKGKGVHTCLFAARLHLIVGFAAWLLEGDRYKTFGATPVEWIFGDYLKNSCYSWINYAEKLHVQARYSELSSPVPL